MKKLVVVVLFSFVIASCTIIVKKNTAETAENMDRVICKLHKEILVNGKCVKRRTFM